MGTADTYRFLVADDDAINRHMMKSLLRQFSQYVDTVANGEEVLMALAENDYDVVFMDVHMPVMDGIEAVTAMRTAISEERMPTVVALTGSSDDKTIRRCLEAGMAECLTKPTDLGRLRLWLHNWEQAHGMFENREDDLLNMNRVRELKDLEASASTESVVAELITMFRTECPIQIAELKTSLTNRDTERIAFLSHKLKGSLLNLGLHAAAEVCSRLEVFSEDENTAPYLRLIEELEDIYTRSYAEFSMYLRSA